MSLRSAARWWFADRRTGRIAIVQPPNALAAVSGGAAVLGRALPATAARGPRAVAEGAVVVWALDEALRGVHPWRRTIGAAVLAVQLRPLVRR